MQPPSNRLLSNTNYRAGATRTVPGRRGMTWDEDGWVDEKATLHRTPDECYGNTFTDGRKSLSMVYPIGVEDIEPNHWVAWVFDLPGCFSKASNQEDAVTNAPSRIMEYFGWLMHHHSRTPQPTENIEVKVAESFRSFISEGDYIVNAFFEDDYRPLSGDDVEHILTLLGFTRDDLIRVIKQISTEQLDSPIRGEVQGSIHGILKHVAWAEWWYFDRLNMAFAREEMPDDAVKMLQEVRAHTRHRLPLLSDNNMFTERVGERWSARKVVRRTLWHERAHTQQIIRYLSQ